MSYNTEVFIDGYAICSEGVHYKEGWERWTEWSYNIINEKHIKQLSEDCDGIDLMYSKTMHFFKIKKNGLGILSSTLQELIPTEYSYIDVDENSDIIRAVKIGSSSSVTLIQYFNCEGKILRSITHDEYTKNGISSFYLYSNIDKYYPLFKNDFCVVCNGEFKGLLDKDGKYLIPPNYEMLEILNENQVVACKNSKFGLITINEVIILDFIYRRLEYIGDEKFIIGLDGKEGVLNLQCPDELMLKELKYHTYSDGAILVSKLTKSNSESFGYEDCLGNELIPLIYDSLSKFENGIAIVNINNRYGLINKRNLIIRPLNSEYIQRINGGYFLTSLNGKYGLLNIDGSLLLKIRYDKIEFQGTRFLVQKNDYMNFLNINGKFLNDEWEYMYEYSDSQEELDDMYRDAFDGDADAVWNID